MKTILLFSSIVLGSGLLFTNMYTSLIDAKSWGSNIPESLATTREYFRTVNPGNFFRVFSPVNQVLALLALILFWKSAPSARFFLGAAFALYVITDAMTFAYFYPRNDIMFVNGSLTDTALLKKTWIEWTSMNWVRSAVILAGVICSGISLHRIYLSMVR